MRYLLVLSVLAGCASRVQHRALEGVEVTTVRRGFTNAHLVEVAGRRILVDTAPEAHTPAVVEGLRQRGVDPASLDLVVATHGHDDHAGGGSLFQELGVPVLLGTGDEAMARVGRNADDTLCPTDRIGRGQLEEVRAASYTPFRPDQVLDGDASVALGELLGDPSVPGEVRAVPGHTAGSLVVTIGEAVFVGDLFRGAIGGRGARVHFYQCDLADNGDDLRDLLQIAPEEAVFFPGHFGPVRRRRVERLSRRLP